MGGLGDPPPGRGPGDLDIDALMSGLQEFRGTVARSAQQMAIETADAWSKDELVHVWVNAQGVMVQAEFDEYLFTKSDSKRVAASIVQATQAAAAKMRAKTNAFQAGLWEKVSQFGARPLDQIDEFKELQPNIPVSAPDSRERRALAESLGDRVADHPDDDNADPIRPTIRG